VLVQDGHAKIFDLLRRTAWLALLVLVIVHHVAVREVVQTQGPADSWVQLGTSEGG
jgi:hypothetical protein